jgi:hypothetical protein
MSPHAYPAVIVLSFVTPLFALAFWLLHGTRKSDDEKQARLDRSSRISLTPRRLNLEARVRLMIAHIDDVIVKEPS